MDDTSFLAAYKSAAWEITVSHLQQFPLIFNVLPEDGSAGSKHVAERNN
jgi:hypothetical protein